MIRRTHDGDRARVVALHDAAFGHVRARQTGFGRECDLRGTLVAVEERRVLGFASLRLATADISTLLGSLEPITRSILEPLGVEMVLGEPMPIRILAPPGLAPVLAASDRVLWAIAVDQAFRRRGLAAALLRAQLEAAQQAGAKSVFAHCLAGSGSRQLFESQGFIPLVELERHYPDGSGMTFLYRPLGTGTR